MTARQTNNSLVAALLSFAVSSAPVSSVAASRPSDSIASSQHGEPVVVPSPMVSIAATANPLPVASTAVLSPELVAVFNPAVEVAVQASQRQPGPVVVCSAPSSDASSSSTSLGGLASSFLATGTGFQPSISSSSTHGRKILLVVPTFVSTFNVSVPALVSSSGHAKNGVSVQMPLSHLNSLADQPFVVGPGFSPILAKLVLEIRNGKFIDLSELLSSSLVLTLHRWKDLMLYKLLILQIYRQFSGRVWLAYDKAFRKHAVATRLVDWSAMNAQLFNFHAAGVALRSSNLGSSADSSEPVGSNSSRIPCMSWNKGKCTAPYTSCRY